MLSCKTHEAVPVMQQFYFGRQDRKLFGVFHEASGSHIRAPAILLCNPFGSEAIMANRMFRVLAGRLARAGVAVLRFEYYGCGDSGGACDSFCVAGAVEDILTAHQELLDRIDRHKRIGWLGLRLGGTLALMAAARAARGPRQLILWDSVMDGRAYLSQLHEAHIVGLSKVMDMSVDRLKKRKASDLTGQVMGFSLTEALAADFMAIDMDKILSKRLARQAMLISVADPEGGTALQSLLEAQGCVTHLYEMKGPLNWLADINQDPLYVPHKVIDLILEKLEGPE